jgi:hypothetical protein
VAIQSREIKLILILHALVNYAAFPNTKIFVVILKSQQSI